MWRSRGGSVCLPRSTWLRHSADRAGDGAMAPRWILAMRWEALLFAHWPVPAERLRGRIPAGLELDTFDGQAWIGIVPFRMANVGLPGLALPGRLGRFGETNVRTYVK